MDTIISSKEAANFLFPLFDGLDHEEIWILIMKKYAPIKTIRISTGDEESVHIDKKAIAKEIILNDGDGVILSHNHPSSNPTPSIADIMETNNLRKALIILDLVLIDHLIITEKTYFSFAEERILNY